MDIQTVATAIKHQRKLKGFSQEVLAEKANISFTSLRRYEKGERVPSENTLRSIASALNLPNNYFVNLYWDKAQREYELELFKKSQLENIKQNGDSEDAEKNFLALFEEFQNNIWKKREIEIAHERMVYSLGEKAAELFEVFDKLTAKGQTKAIELVKLLNYCPEYSKAKNTETNT